MTDPWRDAAPLAGPAIDHIGIVVADIAPTVAALKSRGFRVGDGVPLMQDGRPLDQSSAHCVFANGYVEISAPVPDSGNHLEPLLALGGGIRILALASYDADADHARLAQHAAGAPRSASRTVRLAAGDAEARFRWFPLADVLPGAIVAVVEHRDPATVFAPELRDHPNGATRLADVLLGTDLSAFGGTIPDAPQPLLSTGAGPGINGFSVAGTGAFLDRGDGHFLRGLP